MSKAISTSGPKPPAGSPPIPRSKRGLKGFIKEVGREVKKVIWPTPHETNRLTGIVLAVCAIIMGTLFALSYVADQIITLLTKGTPT